LVPAAGLGYEPFPSLACNPIGYKTRHKGTGKVPNNLIGCPPGPPVALSSRDSHSGAALKMRRLTQATPCIEGAGIVILEITNSTDPRLFLAPQ
jgi:hypothetical protein